MAGVAQSESIIDSEPLYRWLATAIKESASDLHLAAGFPATLRLNGDLTPLPDPPLAAPALNEMLRRLCSPTALAHLDAEKSVDFSLDAAFDGVTRRFRVHLFWSFGSLAACFRVFPADIPEFEWAGFPIELAEQLAFLRDGLVVLTGPTGSGKTTTLAMIVNLLNQSGGRRIITVEEPIEYIFRPAAAAVITQREVGRDVPSFAAGLRDGLRQDPDVILVGEVRDRETAQMCLSAAETGHLVFTTLHTRDAKGAITRFADLFPQDSQSPVRSQLAISLRAVVSQRLLPGVERGGKRQLAMEVMWNIYPIASAIRTGKIESIDNYLVTNRHDGMIGFDESVRQLLLAGRITKSVAEHHVKDLALLNR